jgi:hypothetical protein
MPAYLEIEHGAQGTSFDGIAGISHESYARGRPYLRELGFVMNATAYNIYRLDCRGAGVLARATAWPRAPVIYPPERAFL